MIKNCLLLISLLLSIVLTAQDKSNRGKEFWLGYGYNYHFTNEMPVNSQTLVIYISAEEAAQVTVSVNNTPWSQTVNIPANSVDFSIEIPKSGAGDARIFNEGVSDRGVHIVSDVPVVVYAHQYRSQLSGATMLMPVESYGYTYYSINYSQNASNVRDWYSWFFVVASEDGTRLEITPSDTTMGGWLPGHTYTVNLNKGEIYNVFGKAVFDGTAQGASKDMTGSKIVSIAGADGKCHPVGVFSGSSGIRLCQGDGGEFMHQQVFPANAWGTRYLTYHTLNNFNTNVTAPNLSIYRVAVQDPATVVKKNGVVMTGLINNFYYEYTSTSGEYIEADKPVLVAQYMTNINQCSGSNPLGYGDPEMFYLSPIEQGMKKVLFYNSRNYGIDYNYVNILLPAAGISSLRVDGNPLPAANIIAHPYNPAYSVAVARLTGPGAQHSITSDSTFTATVYGLGIFESYGYNVGCLINNLNAVSEVQNVLNNSGVADTFTCVKTPARITAKIAYQATHIRWHLSEVAGMHPDADSIIVNPIPSGSGFINGRRYYYYTLQEDFVFDHPGTYYIPVTYTSPDIDNCSHTETVRLKVVVKQGPEADFSTGTALCLQDDVNFTGSITANGFTVDRYNWLFDDNTTQTTRDAVKRFATAGPHNIQYTVIATNGCIGDTTKQITVLDAPVADFSDPVAICSRDSVRLEDRSAVSAGTIAEWHWDFGDGNRQVKTTATPFHHRYTAAGNYEISLVVKSTNGCLSDTVRKNVTVSQSPVADFNASNVSCLANPVTFTDASDAVTGVLTRWYWDFGDSHTEERTDATAFDHRYDAAGLYQVKLVVAGNNGCNSDTVRKTLQIADKPSVSFDITGKACADSIFRFTSSVVTGSGVTQWYWNFGDGNEESNTVTYVANHSYPASASGVTVKHAVVIGGCSSDTVSRVIPRIHVNPAMTFTVKQDTLCSNYPVLFESPSTSGIRVWQWNFGDGTGAQVPPFRRSFAAAANYNVQLVVRSDEGCGSMPYTVPVRIAPAPAVDAGPDIFLQAGQSKPLLATSDNTTGYNYVWSPVTALNNPTILQPLVSSDITRLYYLVATDPVNNCSAKDSVYARVISDIYVPTGFTPNGDGLNDRWDIPALQAYPDAYVAVYNRNGEKIYESKGFFQAWDGRYKGQLQPTGVYVYVIRPDKQSGKLLKGTFTLIR